MSSEPSPIGSPAEPTPPLGGRAATIRAASQRRAAALAAASQRGAAALGAASRRGAAGAGAASQRRAAALAAASQRRLSAFRGGWERRAPALRAIWELRVSALLAGSGRPRRAVAVSRGVLAAVAAAVVVAAVAGWGLAGKLAAKPAAPAVAAPLTVHLAATAQITLQAGWTAAAHPPALPGLGAGARAFMPPDGSAGRLVVALVPAQGLPAATVAALRVPSGGSAPAKLAGRPGVAYTALSLRGVQGLTDVYSIPTAAGTLDIACVAPLSDPLPAGTCPGDVLAISAWAPDDGARVLRAHAPVIAKRLDRARVADRAALRRARTPAGQVHAAARLSAAYAAAANAAHAVAPPGAQLPRALSAAAGAYRQLSTAAAHHNRRAWAQARRAAYGAEHEVAAAFRR